MADGDAMFTAAHVAAVRHVMQRILVPCVFVIGLLGNSVSIYVLTRKRMRCTTNIYLTALAITDICYLTMTLLLSLKHYEYVKHNCESYWKFYGILVWLCDACAYISIYISVCFTIERFIAIRYPLKRQTFCTEALAKTVITGVALFCLLSTMSTAFEHQYGANSMLIDGEGRPCNRTLPDVGSAMPPEADVLIWQDGSGDGDGNGDAMTMSGAAVRQLDESTTYWPDFLAQKQRRRRTLIDVSTTMQQQQQQKQQGQQQWHHHLAAPPNEVDTDIQSEVVLTSAPLHAFSTLPHEAEITVSDMETDVPGVNMQMERLMEGELQRQQPQQQSAGVDGNDLATTMSDWRGQTSTYGGVITHRPDVDCHNLTFYESTITSLGLNALYMRVWSFFTLLVFVLIPLCVLATFNCFLIMLVRRSYSLRGEMTNASSMRRTTRQTHSSSVSQENRVTVTLIAVVLLFIVCQLPWAVYLVVSEQIEIGVNLQAIIGNICNFMAAINAASNFFLYCVLSDKYRKTVRELVTGYRYRSQRNTSLYAHTSSAGGSLMATANGSRCSGHHPSATSLVIK